jgi:hypothetical protein
MGSSDIIAFMKDPVYIARPCLVEGTPFQISAYKQSHPADGTYLHYEKWPSKVLGMIYREAISFAGDFFTLAEDLLLLAGAFGNGSVLLFMGALAIGFLGGVPLPAAA